MCRVEVTQTQRQQHRNTRCSAYPPMSSTVANNGHGASNIPKARLQCSFIVHTYIYIYIYVHIDARVMSNHFRPMYVLYRHKEPCGEERHQEERCLGAALSLSLAVSLSRSLSLSLCIYPPWLSMNRRGMHGMYNCLKVQVPNSMGQGPQSHDGCMFGVYEPFIWVVGASGTIVPLPCLVFLDSRVPFRFCPGGHSRAESATC